VRPLTLMVNGLEAGFVDTADTTVAERARRVVCFIFANDVLKRDAMIGIRPSVSFITSQGACAVNVTEQPISALTPIRTPNT
jgi:hypothetical protein